MDTFTARFYERVLQMVDDVDPAVAVKALGVLTRLVRYIPPGPATPQLESIGLACPWRVFLVRVFLFGKQLETADGSSQISCCGEYMIQGHTCESNAAHQPVLQGRKYHERAHHESCCFMEHRSSQCYHPADNLSF